MSEMRPIGLAALLSRGEGARPDAGTSLETARNEGFAAAEAMGAIRLAELQAQIERSESEWNERLEAEMEGSRFAIQAMEQAFAAAVTQTAIGVAKAVLGAEPELPEHTLRSLIDDALAAIPEGQMGTLRMNAETLERARRWLPAGWHAVADPALSAGEVLAEAGAAMALSGIDRRLAEVGRMLGSAK